MPPMTIRTPDPADPLAMPATPPVHARATAARITSRELLQDMREVEIDHEGRIYRLRLTQLNKLILTA
jgi:hemin uptake protein HemP